MLEKRTLGYTEKDFKDPSHYVRFEAYRSLGFTLEALDDEDKFIVSAAYNFLGWSTLNSKEETAETSKFVYVRLTYYEVTGFTLKALNDTSPEIRILAELYLDYYDDVYKNLTIKNSIDTSNVDKVSAVDSLKKKPDDNSKNEKEPNKLKTSIKTGKELMFRFNMLVTCLVVTIIYLQYLKETVEYNPVFALVLYTSIVFVFYNINLYSVKKSFINKSIKINQDLIISLVYAILGLYVSIVVYNEIKLVLSYIPSIVCYLSLAFTVSKHNDLLFIKKK